MRYTQLARLPYFDLVDQIVIDPMHNLFLGVFVVSSTLIERSLNSFYFFRTCQDTLLQHLDPA
jgi:hypothetical protein